MKNIRIFLSINKAYLYSFLIFFSVFFLFYLAYPIRKDVFLYLFFILSFIFFSISSYRFFKFKNILKNKGFANLNKDLYEEFLKEIYDRKEEELEEIKLDKKKKEDELEALLTIWTHHIKTPLAAISLISERKEEFDISDELIRIDDYIASLLSFIKLRKDSLDYNFKSFSLENLIKDIVKRYRHFFIEKKLKLNLDIDKNPIISDPKWLGLVIEQVLFNAIKYTNEGYISISFRNNVLKIKDSGIGIEKADIKNITKFGYSGNTSKRDANSTGIGLFLVDDILNKLGYVYKISSSKNKGTEISINLSRKSIIKD